MEAVIVKQFEESSNSKSAKHAHMLVVHVNDHLLVVRSVNTFVPVTFRVSCKELPCDPNTATDKLHPWLQQVFLSAYPGCIVDTGLSVKLVDQKLVYRFMTSLSWDAYLERFRIFSARFEICGTCVYQLPKSNNDENRPSNNRIRIY